MPKFMFSLLLSAACLFSEPRKLDPLKLDAIEKRMQSYVDRGTIAGAVTLVARDGILGKVSVAGYQDREAKKAMKPTSESITI